MYQSVICCEFSGPDTVPTHSRTVRQVQSGGWPKL